MIVNINEFQLMQKNRVGTKAYNLSRLKAYGYHVCDGFVLSAGFFVEFCVNNDINVQNQSTLISEIKEGNFNESQYFILKNIWDEIAGNSKALIVRSSAVNEDGKTRSYAGIYESVPHVRSFEDMINAVKIIWCSYYSENVFYYNEQFSIDHSIAVLIQNMIQCTESGVAFTKNPLTNEQEIVIESAKGNNQMIINNRETATRYFLDKKDGDIKHYSGIKDLLNERKRKQLYTISLSLEKDFGFPCDFEWGIIHNQVWLFQVRPIVSIYDPDIYLNVKSDNLDCILLDRYAEPASTCYLSLLEKWQEIVYLSFYSTKPGREFSEKPLCFVNNRVYWNNKYQSKYFKDTGSGHKHKMFLLRHMIKSSYANWYNRLDSYNLSVKALNKRFENTKENKALLELLEDIIQNFCHFIGIDHYRFLGFAQILYNELDKVLSKYGIEKRLAEQIIGRESNNNRTVAANDELLELTDLIIKNAVYRDLLHEPDNTVILERLLMEEKYHPLSERVMDFLQKHGHRGTSCDDLYYSHWSEEPEQVIVLLKQLIKAGLHSSVKKSDVEIQKIEDGIFERMGTYVNESEDALFPDIRELMHLTGIYMGLRENQRYYFDKSWVLIRKVILAMANYFIEKKVIKASQDIFHMTLDEITEGILYPNQCIDGNTVIKRIQNFETSKRSKPDYMLKNSKSVIVQKEGRHKSYKVMGISPGNVIGKITIINDLSDLGKVERNDIGVVKTFHPSWTPILKIVSGLIMNYGNFLSHGAVVAREYGIPVVVFNDDAISIFRNGDIVNVNGTSGRIKVII